MNMGKEKIEEKDVRLLRYAVEQAFDGAMRDRALTLLNRRAFELAKNEYLAWLEHKADRYTTVYGYMD